MSTPGLGQRQKLIESGDGGSAVKLIKPLSSDTVSFKDTARSSLNILIADDDCRPCFHSLLFSTADCCWAKDRQDRLMTIY